MVLPSSDMAPVVREERRAADVELVFELADDLLEDVFGGDEADGGTELVDDDGDVAAALLKLLEELDGELGLGDDGELAHDLAEGEAGFAFAAHGERDGAEVHEAGDVFGVDDADDVLGTVRGVVDGDAGVLLLDDAGGGLLERHVGGEGEDLAARRHDLADGDVVELDGAVDDLFLKDREQAHAAGGGGDEFELFGGVDSAFAAQWGAEESEDDGGGGVQQLHDGARDADEDVHGAGDGEGDAFGALEGEGFGDEFAEEDFKVSDEGEGEDDRDGVGVEDRVDWKRVQPNAFKVEDDLGDGGFADPAEGKAGDGDAELDGGEELVDGVLELEGGAGAGTAEGDELLDAGLADADEGELRGHEEACGQDEEGHDDYAEEHPFKHSCQCNGWRVSYGTVRYRPAALWLPEPTY